MLLAIILCKLLTLMLLKVLQTPNSVYRYFSHDVEVSNQRLFFILSIELNVQTFVCANPCVRACVCSVCCCRTSMIVMCVTLCW